MVVPYNENYNKCPTDKLQQDLTNVLHKDLDIHNKVFKYNETLAKNQQPIHPIVPSTQSNPEHSIPVSQSIAKQTKEIETQTYSSPNREFNNYSTVIHPFKKKNYTLQQTPVRNARELFDDQNEELIEDEKPPEHINYSIQNLPTAERFKHTLPGSYYYDETFGDIGNINKSDNLSGLKSINNKLPSKQTRASNRLEELRRKRTSTQNKPESVKKNQIQKQKSTFLKKGNQEGRGLPKGWIILKR